MTAGIVLAGGRSSRFGADKLAAAMPDGRSLLAWTVAAVAEACATVVVVVDPSSPVPTGLPERTVVLRDRRAFEGPVAGLAVALDWLADSEADACAIVVAGDMPTVVPAVLRSLETALVGDLTAAIDCARLEAERQPDGSTVAVFPFAIRRGAAREVARVAFGEGERRLRSVLGRLSTGVVPASAWRALDPEGSTLLDVDRPSDLPGG